MKTSAKVLIPAALIVIAAVGALTALKMAGPEAGSGSPAGEIHEGSMVPDFALKAFQGDATRLSALKAKIVFINFWATWCQACVVEMPSLVKLRAAFKDRGMELIAVNLDDNPDEVVPSALKRLGIDFPVYTDPEGKLGELFDIHAIPVTVVLTPSGQVLKIHTGDLDWNAPNIHAEVEKWLAG